MTGADPPHARPPRAEEELFHYLTDHVAAEAGFIANYQKLAESDDTPEAARYLIRIILEDEERHHRFFRDITAAVGNLIDWSHDPEGVTFVPWGPFSPAFVKTTADFLAAERNDERELRHLQKELQPYRDTTLWPLLVGLMEHDTAKHIELLTFLRDHAQRRRK